MAILDLDVTSCQSLSCSLYKSQNILNWMSIHLLGKGEVDISDVLAILFLPNGDSS